MTPYVTVYGVKVADNWEDLTDGDLSTAIGLDEYGAFVTHINVWTGTNFAGKGAPDDTGVNDFTCKNWRSSYEEDLAIMGNALEQDADWTQDWFADCSNNQLHLYCFEQ